MAFSLEIIMQAFHLACCSFNSLWPSDVIGRHWSGLTLVQVIACFLTALNQCWLLISGVLWHLLQSTFTVNETVMACVTFLNKHTFQQFAFNLDSIIFSQLIYMLGFFILSDKREKCNDILPPVICFPYMSLFVMDVRPSNIRCWYIFYYCLLLSPVWQLSFILRLR